MNYSQLITENKRRLALINDEINLYNPYTGEGSISVDRVEVKISDAPLPKMWLPVDMLDYYIVEEILKLGSLDSFLNEIMRLPATQDNRDMLWHEFEKIRFEYDFEYWAIVTAFIEPKEGGEDIPFRLNRAQRRYLKRLEAMRIGGVPIRIILLKARQWGGSTLTQIYMAWIQIIHKTNWNSVICAHVENTARTIKGMYSKLLKKYPSIYTENGKGLHFSPYEKSAKTTVISEVNCRLTIGSAEKPDGVRGEHTSMAHLSEIGLWKRTEGKTPEDVIQTIKSGILDVPYSMIVYESTAKGVGNYFHNEWNRAMNGDSDMTPVFMSWVDIAELYSLNVKSYKLFIDSMDDYEWLLWKKAGATLEQINWYRHKQKGQKDRWRMMSEYPTWAEEAFQSTGRMVFNLDDITRMRMFCAKPIWTGDLQGETPSGMKAMNDIAWVEDERGRLKVWAFPDHETKMERRYAVSVDIGGRSDASDNSVITVIDRFYMTEPNGVPEIVADWTGHIDHDLLIWKAVQISMEYENALLIIESNTLDAEGAEGTHGEFLMDEIAGAYNNLYTRTSSQKVRDGRPSKWGFQTNKQTKTLIVDNGVRIFRDDGYIERDSAALDEFQIFEIREDGTFGNVVGKDNHDDKVMSRLIGIYVCYDFDWFPLPMFITTRQKVIRRTRIRNASDF